MKTYSLVACLLATFSDGYVASAQDRVVSGCVVDAEGKPVSGADISTFWRANGSSVRSDGRPYDLAKKAEVAEFWGHIGEMQPWHPGARTNSNGAFSLALPSRIYHLVAMDTDRGYGAIVSLASATAEQEVRISLEPLVTISARVVSSDPERQPAWSHVYVSLPENADRPLANTRLVSCGSEHQRFEFRLPKGTYKLDIYGTTHADGSDIDLRVSPDPILLEVDGSTATIDLGSFELAPDEPDRQDLEKAARVSGRWNDFTEHYGEPAPNWRAVDARGINPATTIGDLHGKWVLLEFWGLSCAPCLTQGMPKMMDFYERHGDDRDKFEIVGICIDYSGRLKRMADLERELKPIVEKVWNGRQIKFPIVLDNSFKTWERFGIPGLGTVVLVDPKGNIVEGDEQTLARLLDNDVQPPPALEPPPALAPLGVPDCDGTSPPPAN